MRRIRRLSLAFLFVLPLLAPAVSEAKDDDTDFVKAALAEITMGEPLRGAIAIVIPLIVKEPPTDVGVLGPQDAKLTFQEPEFPSHRYDVEVENGSDKPVLLMGGSVLVGGERDRMLLHDVIVGAGTTLEVEAWPASSTSEIRKQPVPFELAQAIAPNYLRRKADHGGSHNAVPTFIARNAEFRNEGDTRKSLAAIGSSEVLQKATAEGRRRLDEALAKTQQKGTIVGWMIALRGRLQSLVIFGDTQIAAGTRGAYLLGATYAATAVSIQAKKKNVPIPGRDDPEATFRIVMKDAQKLWDGVLRAKVKVDRDQPEGAVGQSVLIQLPNRTRGRAVGLDGRLVHLEIFPHDPFESALYGSKIEIPDEDIMSDDDRIGIVELGRLAGEGRRLTHAEQRVLERLRPPGPSGVAGGGRGGASGVAGGGMAGGGMRR